MGKIILLTSYVYTYVITYLINTCFMNTYTSRENNLVKCNFTLCIQAVVTISTSNHNQDTVTSQAHGAALYG